MTRRILTTLASVAFAAVAQGPPKAELYTGETAKVSEHVWVMTGNPNIAIVVGTRGTLVVDTGLGAPNGEVVARTALKLSPSGTKLYLTTTHFHPEHAAGEPGFPASAVLIRNNMQQKEFELNGLSMVEMFSQRGPEQAQWLSNRNFRTPDVLFENEAKLDLGGVTARLLWYGGAHTKGDEVTFVEPDNTLVSGDVVQNKVVPNIFLSNSGDGGTPSSWLAVVDRIAALPVAHVIPDHSAPGDGSLVAAERNFIADVQTRALALRKQRVSAADAATQLGTELKAKYADWPNLNVRGFVQSIYSEQ
jgi:glyoxylase-like metal-dependent hydrolase (beta-lactamase superfamily II)